MKEMGIEHTKFKLQPAPVSGSKKIKALFVTLNYFTNNGYSTWRLSNFEKFV